MRARDISHASGALRVIALTMNVSEATPALYRSIALAAGARGGEDATSVAALRRAPKHGTGAVGIDGGGSTPELISTPSSTLVPVPLERRTGGGDLLVSGGVGAAGAGAAPLAQSPQFQSQGGTGGPTGGINKLLHPHLATLPHPSTDADAASAAAGDPVLAFWAAAKESGGGGSWAALTRAAAAPQLVDVTASASDVPDRAVAVADAYEAALLDTRPAVASMAESAGHDAVVAAWCGFVRAAAAASACREEASGRAAAAAADAAHRVLALACGGDIAGRTLAAEAQLPTVDGSRALTNVTHQGRVREAVISVLASVFSGDAPQLRAALEAQHEWAAGVVQEAVETCGARPARGVPGAVKAAVETLQAALGVSDRAVVGLATWYRTRHRGEHGSAAAAASVDGGAPLVDSRRVLRDAADAAVSLARATSGTPAQSVTLEHASGALQRLIAHDRDFGSSADAVATAREGVAWAAATVAAGARGARSFALPLVADLLEMDPNCAFEGTVQRVLDVVGLQRRKEKKASGGAGGTSAPKGKAARPPAVRPNLFLGIRLKDPVLWEKTSAFQSRVMAAQPFLRKAIIPPSDLHITLLVLVARSQEDRSAASERLRSLAPQIADVLGKLHPFRLRVAGLASFGGQVLHAQLEDGAAKEALSRVTELLEAAFRRDGLTLEAAKAISVAQHAAGGAALSGADRAAAIAAAGRPRPFHPHATLFKMSRLKPRDRKAPGAVKSIDQSLWESHRGEAFGDCVVPELLLLDMMKRDPDNDGFYKTVASLHLPHDPSALLQEAGGGGGGASARRSSAVARGGDSTPAAVRGEPEAEDALLSSPEDDKSGPRAAAGGSKRKTTQRASKKGKGRKQQAQGPEQISARADAGAAGGAPVVRRPQRVRPKRAKRSKAAEAGAPPAKSSKRGGGSAGGAGDA